MGTLSVNAMVHPSGRSLGVSTSQGNVTFSWTGNRTHGNYADGPGWVMVGATGSVTVAEPTPAQTTDGGGKTVNGAQLTPVHTNTHAYNQNSTIYSAGLAATFPLTAVAGDVLVKSVQASPFGLDRHGVNSEYASLFFVDTIPPAGAYSPAAVSWSSRANTNDYMTLDVSAWVAANCPSYDTTGHTLPTYAQLIYNVGIYSPVWPQAYGGVDGYQDLTPDVATETIGGGSSSNWGDYLSEPIAEAMLALCSDAFSTAEKEALAEALIINGKQWYDAIKGRGVPVDGNGGHFQFQLGPMALYLHATGQTAALATLVADTGGNYLQAFQVTADMVANDFVPHSSTTKPHTWYLRTIGAGAVSGLNVSLPTQAGDPTYMDVAGLLLKRQSDSATAVITTVPDNTSAGGFTVTIDAQPTPAFAEGDVVYMEAPYTISAGDYDWCLDIYSVNPESYSPSKDGAGYRGLNHWSGQLMGIKALGAWPADAATALAYVQRCNASNTPAGHDFYPHHETTWVSEFWADHAATIFA